MRSPHHLNALRAFEAAARHLSYVRAAEELNVSPAAIGQLVRGLEDAHGVVLFHRSRSGPARLELTEVAVSALADLQAGFDLLSSAVARFKADEQDTSITVTVPPAFADKWLLARVEGFQALYPQYELRLDTNGKLVDFTTDRTDLGIRFGAGHWPGLMVTYLMAEEFFPVCSPALLSGGQPLASVADLKHHPLLHDVSMRGVAAFPTWETWLRQSGFDYGEARRGLQINDSAAVMQTAISGNGVALGRSSLVAADLAAGRLVRPFGEALSCELAYYIVQRQGVEASPAVEAFKQWLLAQVAGDR
ncbi:transcriptional regulator GcvA [Pseudomonas gingeri]|uniref:transcriptional regulator GcvA n=1 Tax=Pseudomonas gingeri TaxID=117681 RepID=UPI0015A39AB1|nr:transcriptional regulator GcvA [Pseudomonas gingeri]NWD04850.1 transcriptional regulator GcvA [Pseudomonas gingeri]NWD51827.1 transcriptional regulator GcvA [Pseudomonas gingeri]NWE30784.1 transcriptional regulator GcvA [Pseudomonas gingeri]NWE58846.1 transcriptional regulator GcvA [Pseudomonas gingeri]NWF02566.1 transcriptional regulator GcvA [Pseudomonas gingeri]